jgi:hypothetical protein
MTRWPAAAIALLTLAGCAAEHWEKPGATPAEFETAKSQCMARSLALFPPNVQKSQITDSATTQPQTTCVRGVCTTTPGKYTPALFADVDQNENPRNADFARCLEVNGWAKAR